MKRTFRFYHRSTGIFADTLYSATVPELALNTPPDHVAIEHANGVSFDPLSQRVDVATGMVVDYQPSQPSAQHEWDAGTRRWRLNSAAVEGQARRAQALAEQPLLLRTVLLEVAGKLGHDSPAARRLREIECDPDHSSAAC